jgi:hypothetical protein
MTPVYIAAASSRARDVLKLMQDHPTWLWTCSWPMRVLHFDDSNPHVTKAAWQINEREVAYSEWFILLDDGEAPIKGGAIFEAGLAARAFARIIRVSPADRPNPSWTTHPAFLWAPTFDEALKLIEAAQA